ncbi:hypothetical protein [Nocardia cyriacigeorgica]|uniref:Low molecular weight antigen MTB12-like C-terminal domain-containing protein n=1 Tax=Nocardia cyriacigeorgica TaxID=135487 RepID=A0A5R8NSD2_9NOCA|nr:hypothetical protein [Nocardia cyriacigeorgica]TLF77627.1 hypothetical protein FEK34_15035 [Nocardia cyriacigeorgica]TLG01886.1 hypothetical protein FEK35_22755 [Nocardia cyriacigeorgica]
MRYTLSSRAPRPVRAALAAAALVALAATSACGSGVDDDAVAAARSAANAALSSSAAATSSSVAARVLPTAAELDAQIKRALDPALPDDERTALIEDGEAFRDAIPDMYKALQDNPHAVYGVTDPVFDNHDGTLTATMRLDKDGTGTQIRTTVVHFVYIDGKWKISRTDLCGILRSADYRTPACG